MDESSASPLDTLAEQLYEATVRLETVIWLPAAHSDFCESDALRFLSEETDEALKLCFADIPQWLLDKLGTKDGTELFIEWLDTRRLRGFAIQISTPVMRHTAAGATYSWSYYTSTWRYGNSFEEAVQAGLAWAAQRRQAEAAKARAAS